MSSIFLRGDEARTARSPRSGDVDSPVDCRQGRVRVGGGSRRASLVARRIDDHPFGWCFCFGNSGRRGEKRPVPALAGMATCRWHVAKAVCVSAAAAAERASSPAVLMTSPFGCLVFFYAAARPFVGADAPGGSDTRWRGSKNEGSLRMVGYSAGKPSAISPHSTNRGLPFFRLARMIVTDHTGRSDISQWSRTRLEISSRSCVKRKA